MVGLDQRLTSEWALSRTCGVREETKADIRRVDSSTPFFFHLLPSLLVKQVWIVPYQNWSLDQWSGRGSSCLEATGIRQSESSLPSSLVFLPPSVTRLKLSLFTPVYLRSSPLKTLRLYSLYLTATTPFATPTALDSANSDTSTRTTSLWISRATSTPRYFLGSVAIPK